jgi:hypothetical protein
LEIGFEGRIHWQGYIALSGADTDIKPHDSMAPRMMVGKFPIKRAEGCGKPGRDIGIPA